MADSVCVQFSASIGALSLRRAARLSRLPSPSPPRKQTAAREDEAGQAARPSSTRVRSRHMKIFAALRKFA